MSTTDGLLAWLTAQLDERERIARAAIPEGGSGDWRQFYSCLHIDPHVPPSHDLCAQIGIWGDEVYISDEGGHTPEQANHIVQNDPATVLADIAAKRQVLELFAFADRHVDETRRTTPEYRLVQAAEVARDALLRAVQHLASAYKHETGYREEWKPR
jgi:uncharacterized protein DUF6221